jgi:glucose/arabinose dehydrogenase
VKKIIILLVAALLIYGGLRLYQTVRTNTHFLNPRPPKREITLNNLNQKPEEESQEFEFLNLYAKNVDVPEIYKIEPFSSNRLLNLPKGFNISVYAAGVKGARFFVFDEDNNMFVTSRTEGELTLVKDSDRDGIAEEIILVDSGLRSSHGIDLFNGDLYVGEEHQIVVYRGIKSDGTFDKKEVLIADLPSGGTLTTGSGHVTRTVKIGPDEKIYVSIGSSCNVCEEEDERRATITRYNLDGSFDKIVAGGLRNSVGFEFFKTGEFTYDLWSVDNGRDRIGDDLPVEEVNVISPLSTEPAFHYGWPYCHGKGIPNPEFPEKVDFCANETHFPRFEMQAHSAPLGLNFYQEGNLPSELLENLFIAFHGSWNRTIPTGYKIVRLETGNYHADIDNFNRDHPKYRTNSYDTKPINFITGWLEDSGEAWGRPVDVGFDNNGVMYITDDKAGAVYRVTYEKN